MTLLSGDLSVVSESETAAVGVGATEVSEASFGAFMTTKNSLTLPIVKLLSQVCSNAERFSNPKLQTDRGNSVSVVEPYYHRSGWVDVKNTMERYNNFPDRY